MAVSEKCLAPNSFEDSFEALAMPLFDRLYNFAHWLTQNREEAEDLVQETYTKALKGFSSFQPGTNFRAWIYRILRNTFLTSRAGLKAQQQFDYEEEATNEAIYPPDPRTPESILLEKLDRQVVHRALDQLPVVYREALLLCDFEEMSYQEISATLGVPVGTVMSRLSRARKALRENARELQKGVR
jgi:RNA polymerase sigma-70 factor, ECF subfamily